MHLTQRDLIDFGSDEGQAGAGQSAAGQNVTAPAVDVAQLVFLGMDIIIPLVSLELLGYPKLCLLYFQLLAHMMEVCPVLCGLTCVAAMHGALLAWPTVAAGVVKVGKFAIYLYSLIGMDVSSSRCHPTAD